MTFATFVTENRGAKIKADIAERWGSRVLPLKLHEKGRSGAEMYIAQFGGKSLGWPKLVQLALKAEVEGCLEMATGFWSKAYEISTGSLPDLDQYPAPAGTVAPAPAAKKVKSGEAKPSVFPSHLQPGKLVTMQPVDAPQPREVYITSDFYIGQPKIDGKRAVAFVENGIVTYQARSLSLMPTLSPDIDNALLAAAQKMHTGAFILDGEFTFLDWCGGEHRTGAQALQVNIEAGHEDIAPKPKYCVFEALHMNGIDLTAHGKFDRVKAAGIFKLVLESVTDSEFDAVEVVETAYSTAEKKLLAQKQKAQNREGEVWTHVSASYTGGKTKGREYPTVRTKYPTDWELVITGLTPSTVEDRPFGAIEVAQRKGNTLVPMGSVGTGFSFDEMEKIALLFQSSQPNSVVIKVVSYGTTENGKLWLARFDGFPGDE